jgi:hypothetical protein
MAQIVKNNSEGYGYNYASLSDIAKQGYEIPKMKVINANNIDYVYYFDKELNDWQQGARIVVPSSKGMNEAQLYGSALTYARRYTVQLALGLACDDDKEIENIGKQEYATPKQIEMLEKYYQGEQLKKLLAYNKISSIEDMPKAKATELIGKIMEKQNDNK